MSLIAMRDKSFLERKKIKEEIDKSITLSDDVQAKPLFMSEISNNKVVLLDEGAVVNGNGYPEFYIAKGTCEKLYAKLTEGEYTLGHDFANTPLKLGTWSKNDITLVEKEDGRHALEVEVHLNEDLSIVQDLKKMDFGLCVSIDGIKHTNFELSTMIGIEVVDDIDLYAIAICGNPKNVNSTGLKLSEEVNMGTEETKEEEVVVETVGTVDTVDTVDNSVDNVENAEEETKADETKADETEGEKVEVTETKMSEVMDAISKLTETVTTLKAELANAKEENIKLSDEIKASKDREKEFCDKINLSLGNLSKAEEKQTKANYAVPNGDGVLC